MLSEWEVFLGTSYFNYTLAEVTKLILSLV